MGEATKARSVLMVSLMPGRLTLRVAVLVAGATLAALAAPDSLSALEKRLSGAVQAAPQDPLDPPTFSNEVVRILQESCQRCSPEASGLCLWRPSNRCDLGLP